MTSQPPSLLRHQDQGISDGESGGGDVRAWGRRAAEGVTRVETGNREQVSRIQGSGHTEPKAFERHGHMTAYAPAKATAGTAAHIANTSIRIIDKQG